MRKLLLLLALAAFGGVASAQSVNLSVTSSATSTIHVPNVTGGTAACTSVVIRENPTSGVPALAFAVVDTTVNASSVAINLNIGGSYTFFPPVGQPFVPGATLGTAESITSTAGTNFSVTCVPGDAVNGLIFAKSTVHTTSGGTPSGSAGGDLSGTYPNPTVVATHLSSPLPTTQGGSAHNTTAVSGTLAFPIAVAAFYPPLASTGTTGGTTQLLNGTALNVLYQAVLAVNCEGAAVSGATIMGVINYTDTGGTGQAQTNGGTATCTTLGTSSRAQVTINFRAKANSSVGCTFTPSGSPTGYDASCILYQASTQ